MEEKNHNFDHFRISEFMIWTTMIQHNKSRHLETEELITSSRFSAHIVVERIL